MNKSVCETCRHYMRTVSVSPSTGAEEIQTTCLVNPYAYKRGMQTHDAIMTECNQHSPRMTDEERAMMHEQLAHTNHLPFYWPDKIIPQGPWDEPCKDQCNHSAEGAEGRQPKVGEHVICKYCGTHGGVGTFGVQWGPFTGTQERP